MIYKGLKRSGGVIEFKRYDLLLKLTALREHAKHWLSRQTLIGRWIHTFTRCPV
jgi:hypothetical protein